MSAHLAPTAAPGQPERLRPYERPARRPAALAGQPPQPAAGLPTFGQMEMRAGLPSSGNSETATGVPSPRPARILPQDLNEPRAGLLLALDLGPAYALRSGRFRTSRSPHSYHPLSVAWALGSGLAATVPTRISQTVVLTAEGRRYVAENRRRLAVAADWNPRAVAGDG